MWSSLILVQITAKYLKCRISFLKIFHIPVQYLYSQISLTCSNSHIFSVSNLENHFMEQLFLFPLPDFFIIRSKAGKKTPVNSKHSQEFFGAPFWHRWSYFSILNLSLLSLIDKFPLISALKIHR